MKPNSKERCEAAERLRFCSRHIRGSYDIPKHIADCVEIGEVVDDEGNHFSAVADRKCSEIVLNKLADLIDPTCTAGKHTGSHPYETCSVCGGIFEHVPSYYSYCPNCGARVIN